MLIKKLEEGGPVGDWDSWLKRHGYPDATFSKFMPGPDGDGSGVLEIYRKGSTTPTYLQVGPQQYDPEPSAPEPQPQEEGPSTPSDTNILLQTLRSFEGGHGLYGNQAGTLRHPATPKSVDDAFISLGFGNPVGAAMMRNMWETASDEKKDELMAGYERAYKKRTNQ